MGEGIPYSNSYLLHDDNVNQDAETLNDIITQIITVTKAKQAETVAEVEFFRLYGLTNKIQQLEKNLNEQDVQHKQEQKQRLKLAASSAAWDEASKKEKTTRLQAADNLVAMNKLSEEEISHLKTLEEKYEADKTDIMKTIEGFREEFPKVYSSDKQNVTPTFHLKLLNYKQHLIRLLLMYYNQEIESTPDEKILSAMVGAKIEQCTYRDTGVKKMIRISKTITANKEEIKILADRIANASSDRHTHYGHTGKGWQLAKIYIKMILPSIWYFPLYAIAVTIGTVCTLGFGTRYVVKKLKELEPQSLQIRHFLTQGEIGGNLGRNIINFITLQINYTLDSGYGHPCDTKEKYHEQNEKAIDSILKPLESQYLKDRNAYIEQVFHRMQRGESPSKQIETNKLHTKYLNEQVTSQNLPPF